MSDRLFIAIEGIDGCGKSTQLDLLAKHFAAANRQAVRVGDPGTSPLAVQLREILLHKVEIPLTADQEVLLFTAARCDLAAHIKGLLASDSDVLADRWVMSTHVYQGVMGGVAKSVIGQLHNQFVRLNPDVYILLDLRPETALKRRTDRAKIDRFERNPLSWHAALRQGYLDTLGAVADMMCESIVATIDGERPVEHVFDAVLEVCRRHPKFQAVEACLPTA